MIYKAQSKEEMGKVSTPGDAVEFKRAKWAQKLTNKASSSPTSAPMGVKVIFLTMLFLCFGLQYLYTDLAAKERAHFTQEIETPHMRHARKIKVVYSDVRLSAPLYHCISEHHLYQKHNIKFLVCVENCFNTRASLWITFFVSSSRTNTKNSMRRWSTDTRPLPTPRCWSEPRNPTSSPVMWVYV